MTPRARDTIYLAGIAHALGELRPIEQALAGDVQPELMAKLRENGFRQCALSPATPVELARAAAERLLATLDLPPGHVGAVVYATCSYWSDDAHLLGAVPAVARLSHRVATALLAPLGLQRAPLFGVYLAESGNVASALRVAKNLIAVDGLQNVLVVTADQVPRGEGEYRAMPSGVTINSDAAAACLVSSERRHGFELEAVAQKASPRMASLEKGQGMQKYLEIITGLRAAARSVFEALGTRPGDYTRLVANNYSLQTLHGFADALGFQRDRLFLDNVGRFAHAFSADALINLADLEAAHPASPGDRVLALSTGPLTWGAVSLKKC